MTSQEGAPRQSLSAVDVLAIIVGLVIGAGIFRAPAVVAANAGSEPMLLVSWLLGGMASMAGALCYAELAACYPHTGGEYHFLRRAYGSRLALLFGWSRMVVLQTGSIALLAFVLADYLVPLVPSVEHGSVWMAAGAVVLLTALNMAGLHASKSLQNLLSLVTVTGLLSLTALGLLSTTPTGPETEALAHPLAGTAPQGTFGLAMVFVLLTYGGWNEAAYVSAELKNTQRNMWKVLTAGLGIVTVVYVLANLAYVRVMGLTSLSRSDAVATDFSRLVLGDAGALLVSALIAVAVLASLNVTILTGARTNYAMARDFPPFRLLGHWSERHNAPSSALLIQGFIAVALVVAGSTSRSGFEAMVSYVSPVFWLFFLLTTVSLLVLRRRDPQRHRPFRVPCYPWTPLLFAGICAYMFYSSLAYSGRGALFGIVLLFAGIPLTLWGGRRNP